MDRVLVAGASNGALQALEAEGACGDVAVDAVASPEDAFAYLDDPTRSYVALVVGPDVPDPLPVMQRAHALAADLRTVVLVEGARYADTEERILRAPGVGQAITIAPADDPDATVAVVREACSAAKRGRAYREALRSLNDQLLAATGPERSRTPHIDVVMDRAPLGILIVDAAGNVASANRRAATMLEPPEPLLGQPLDAALARSGFTGAPTISSLVARGDDPFRMERSDGERILELTAGMVEADADRRAAVVLIADATARVRAEREQARSAEMLRLQSGLLVSQTEAAFDGILVVDPQGQIVSYNRRFVDMWDIPDSVVASRSDDEALAAVLDKVQDPDSFLARVRYLYEHPAEESRDELRLRDGRIYERYGAPVRGESDLFYGRVWFFHDVTQTKRQEEALQLAAGAGDILAETLDPALIPQRLARLAVPRLSDWCIVYAVTPTGSIERVALEHTGADAEALIAALAEIPLDPNAPDGVPAVIRTGKPMLETHATASSLSRDVTAPEDLRRVLETLPVSSWMCVPMTARGRTLGAMAFAATRSGRHYGPEDLELAEDLGHRAALAMDNATLFEARTHIARTLQQSLLPPTLPHPPGLEVAARYHAAGEGNEVGGDFYDMFSTGGRTWGLVVGDVCGKGPEAAALTALTRYTIRTAAMQVRKPRRILSILNDAVVRQHGGERYCTVVYIKLEATADGHVLTVARGGHPPPMIVRADGSIEEMDPTGGLIGTFTEVQLEEQKNILRVGDTLILYTDGVTEARQGAELYTQERLRAVIAGAPQADPEALADRISDDVLRFQGESPRDDIALVVVRAIPIVKGRSGSTGGHARYLTARRRYEPEPRVIADVRRFIAQTVVRWGAADAEEIAVLLGSEVAANSVLHAGTPFEVRMERRDGEIVVRVRDAAQAQPRPVQAGPDAESGRGLAVVEALAERWGVDAVPDGKEVWFAVAAGRG